MTPKLSVLAIAVCAATAFAPLAYADSAAPAPAAKAAPAAAAHAAPAAKTAEAKPAAKAVQAKPAAKTVKAAHAAKSMVKKTAVKAVAKKAPAKAVSHHALMSRHRVERMQAALSNAHYKVALDGIWGPKTRTALRDFQKAHGLKATGRLDHATAKKLAL